MMRCSILAASKMQVYPTVTEGTSFRGCGLPVTQFLRGTPSFTYSPLDSLGSIDFFFQSLKHFIEYVHLPTEVQHGLQSMINHFAFILTMFTKYEEVVTRTGVASKLDDSENLKTLGWLVFILARVHVLHRRNEVVECACLLIAVLTLMLGHSRRPGKEPMAEPETRKMLCGIFKLKSADPVLTLEDAVRGMLQQLMPENGPREIRLDDLFDLDRVGLNVKRLSSLYQQRITPEELDERIFVVSEMRITTPLKFTPFARQGVANKIFTPAKPEDSGPVARKLHSSKRILTYEMQATGKENVTLGTKLNEIKFSQYALQSPYTVSKLPVATPITRAMEMNNWLQDHVGKVAVLENGLTSTINNLLPNCSPEVRNGGLIMGVLEAATKKISAALEKETAEMGQPQRMHIKGREIRCMYFRIVDELLSLEEKKVGLLPAAQVLSNPEFHKATIAAATEVVLFVHNSMAVRFEQILELCEVQAFEFWKLVRPFLKFDPVMPGPLRMHFQQIEIKILTSLGWQRNSSIHRLLAKIIDKERQEQNKHAIRIENNFSLERDDVELKPTPMKDIPKEDSKEEPTPSRMTVDTVSLQLFSKEQATAEHISLAHELFFQRVLHVVSSKIVAMSEALGVGDESTKEKTWELMKHCLSVETDMMIDRHIDQLLLCTIYAISKMSPSKFTFNNIISHYIDLHAQASENITSLFFNVKIDEHKFEDIIGFYNHIYILRVKSAVCSICQTGPAVQKNMSATVHSMAAAGLVPVKRKIRALAPESPLNANLPPAQLQYQLGTYSKTFIGNASFKIGSPLPMMTPRTKALYAFGESPCPGMCKASFTPSVVSDRKGTYKDSLRSQILLQQRAHQSFADPASIGMVRDNDRVQ